MGPDGVEQVAEPSPSSQNSRYIHSDIYARLVDDDEDLVGLVAYGLYQVEKRRWIDQYQAKHGELPSEKEIKEFCFAYDDKRLAKLTSESQELIFRVTEARLDERIEEMSDRAFNIRAVQELSKVHTAVTDISGYKHHIIGHILGFLVLVGISALVLLVIKAEPTISWALSELHLAP